MEERAEPAEVVTRVAVLRLEPSGIVRLTCKPGVEYTLQDAKEDLAAFAKLGQGVRRPLLVDGRDVRAVDQETRNFWSGKEMLKYFKGVAIMTGNSSITNMIANFMITIARPATPTKMFANETDAMKWLEWFLDDEHEGPPPSRRFFGGDLPPPSKRGTQLDAPPPSRRGGQLDAPPPSKRGGQLDAPPPTKR